MKAGYGCFNAIMQYSLWKHKKGNLNGFVNHVWMRRHSQQMRSLIVNSRCIVVQFRSNHWRFKTSWWGLKENVTSLDTFHGSKLRKCWHHVLFGPNWQKTNTNRRRDPLTLIVTNSPQTASIQKAAEIVESKVKQFYFHLLGYNVESLCVVIALILQLVS